MLDKNVTMLLITTGLGVFGAISYSWASWTTETLIAVDKRTEVMATQIEFIKQEMERTYGNVTQSNVQTSVQASAEE
tara:strand:+ start:501 stop:731 length:231 start_codon:yes stop_codon:yes gene_type:complete